MDNLNLFIRSIFIDNMIFAYFLGMCSFIAVSKNVKTAFGLGIAVTFMLTITLPINYLLENYVLRQGALSWLGAEYADVDLSFLSLIVFIAVIASMTQLVEMVVEKYAPALYSSLGIFLPLIAVNCAILGGSLFMHAERFRIGLDSRMCWWRLGHRLAPCHNSSGSRTRTCGTVFQCPRSSSWRGYHLYHHGPHGNSVHELPGH